MPRLKPPARTTATGSAIDVGIDHARLEEDDLHWLAPVERLTLWAVDVPVGFLAKLPNLRLLDLRGGSAEDVSVVAGCTQLRGLVLNQIRGLHDLSAIAGLPELRLLSLYGLPQLTNPPSLEGLAQLGRLELGSLKGVHTLEPLLRAPALRELLLHNKVVLSDADVELIAGHPTLEQFGWIALDVPISVSKPVVARVKLPSPRAMFPHDWLTGD